MGSSAVRTWTINGDFLALQPNGVVRYAREVTSALDALAGEGHPLLRHLKIRIVAPREPTEPLSLRSIPVRVVPEVNRPRIPQFWVQMQLPWYVRGGLLSFCNLGPVCIRRQIICIHDLQTRLAADSYGRGFRLAHRVLLPVLGRCSRVVTTVSGYSRDHLTTFGVVPEGKLVVTYNGHEHATRWDPARAQLELPGERPFVLGLGRQEKHKNNELLQRIARPLDQLGIGLCVAGGVDADAFGSAEQRPSNLHLLGRISDDDFAKALDNALCFVLPSRIEGFGLPALEAMARGCPTVVSDAACLPEIYGDAALYAPPDDDAVWVDAIRRLRDSPDLRRNLRLKGLARARSYSWRTIAETYLTMMARVDASQPVTGDCDPAARELAAGQVDSR